MRAIPYRVLKAAADLSGRNLFETRAWLDGEITAAIERHDVAFLESIAVVRVVTSGGPLYVTLRSSAVENAISLTDWIRSA